MKRRPCALAALLCLPAAAPAHPQFQEFVAKHSGRAVNCALCHTHSNGPEGLGPGQIGSLNKEAMARLNHARMAIQPGRDVDSPILNAFGNLMVSTLGKQAILDARFKPERIAELLNPSSDLDGDGIPDATEYLEGTHPLKPQDGLPWRLFQINLRKNIPELLVTFAATLAGLYGLRHLLHAFGQAMRGPGRDDEEDGGH